jgi:hypothetical protein
VKHEARQKGRSRRSSWTCEGRDGDGWIFTRGDLSAWEPGQLSLSFARLGRARDLAITIGVDLQTVSRALGHETGAITSCIYLDAVDAF